MPRVNRTKKTKKMIAQSNLIQDRWTEKGISKSRLRGILKGIVIDGVVNQKEYPFYKAAQRASGLKNIKVTNARKEFNPRQWMSPADYKELKRTVKGMRTRLQREDGHRAADFDDGGLEDDEPAPPPPPAPAPQRRRRRADADVVANVDLTRNLRTRSGNLR